MGEQCGEPGLSCAAGTACFNCRCGPVCGDGTIQPGEECDPPSPPSCAGTLYCSATCHLLARPSVCGNGCADATEQCGEPGLPSDCGLPFAVGGTPPPPRPCVNCQCPAVCGNGVLDPGEQCDLSAGGAQCSQCGTDCLCHDCADAILQAGDNCSAAVSCPCCCDWNSSFHSCECTD